jgi:hypothetical protein
MPALTPHRHEIFCRNIISAVKLGKSQAWAYRQAGYSVEDNSAYAAASRLLKSDKIKRRIEELGAPAVRKAQFTLESLSEEVAATIKDARAKGQNSVVVRALELGAKLHGLLTERVDVQHSFTDRAEAFQMISKRHGEEVAGILREALERGADAAIEERRALRARDVTPSPAPSAGQSEADAWLEEQPRRD